MKNAFTTLTDLTVYKDKNIDSVTVAYKNYSDIIGKENFAVEYFKEVEYGNLSDLEILNSNGMPNNIFLPTMNIPDAMFDKIIEYVLKTRCKFMVVSSRSLEEVGYFDAKFRLSPIMLLHKLGLLTSSKIVGGVYLDNEDVEIMVQEKAELILTPSYDFGHGSGIMNALSYLNRGLKISLGTADNSYNVYGDMLKEAEILSLVSSASMCKQNAISDYQIKAMLNG